MLYHKGSRLNSFNNNILLCCGHLSSAINPRFPSYTKPGAGGLFGFLEFAVDGGGSEAGLHVRGLEIGGVKVFVEHLKEFPDCHGAQGTGGIK